LRHSVEIGIYGLRETLLAAFDFVDFVFRDMVTVELVSVLEHPESRHE